MTKIRGKYYENKKRIVNKESNAKYYYDSTLLNLAKADQRRPELSATSANLSEIAANLEVINLQDSLIRVSSLSVKDKRALALKIKSEQKLL